VTREVESLLVPAAQRLPSASAYLAHLDADPSLVRLASNESAEPPSPRVAAALAEVYEHAHLYPSTAPPLRHGLARRHGVDLRQVLVGAGSTEVIDATLRAFVAAGDEVVVPSPSWPVYRARLEALAARVVEVPLRVERSSFAYDVGALVSAITPHTKVVVACTPNNPTGNTLGLDDLHTLADAAPLLLVDAAYADFDPGVDAASLVAERRNVVVTRTFSKAQSLAGLRVGYALGDADVLDYIARFLVPGSSVGVAALAAATAALDDDEYTRAHVERVRSERARLAAGLRERGLHVFDSHANFLAVDPAPSTPAELAARIRDGGVIVRVLGDLVRITVGSAAQNDLLLRAL
jgi:histidinol-phosphate aminotransferase